MGWDAGFFTTQISKSIDTFDGAGAEELCNQLIGYLNNSDEKYPEREAKKVLQKLRNKRYFGLMQRVADACIQSGQNSAQIRRQYAQALIDQNNLSATIDFLKALVNDTQDNPGENAEARGLLGRVYKQLFVSSCKSKPKRSRDYINEAIRWYLDVYAMDQDNSWHGINGVALLLRATRDKIPVAGVVDSEAAAKEIAQTMLTAIEDKWEAGKASMWDSGIAAEACLALKRHDEALEWLARYVREPAGDAFEFESTHRQFVEIWQLDMETEPGSSLLPILRSYLLQHDGGQLDLSTRDLQPGALKNVSRPHFEKVLGRVRYVSYKFLLQGLERAKAIGRIEREADQGFGTGFLVRGRDLHPSLGEELVMLTNAHVISNDDRVTDALRFDEATVTFQMLKETGECKESFQFADILWTSPPWELDATLLKLDENIEDIQPYPIAPRLPLADGEQRVYVIGHPKGGTLSFSIQDNILLDHESPFLHYRAPTEGGSSGSPVFNQQWKLIGIHHAGSKETKKLHDMPGTYAANEGIWIQSVVEAMKQKPPKAV